MLLKWCKNLYTFLVVPSMMNDHSKYVLFHCLQASLTFVGEVMNQLV